jgi:methionyl-tRNA formyltransferase
LSLPPLAPVPEDVRRLVYLGTPELAVPPLRALVAAGFEIVLVVSQPDRRRGRGSDLIPSPVKSAALELGLPVSDRVDDALEVDADLGVVVAFGQIIAPHVLAALPMVNIHFSLLPRWRGAAPVERAILAGDEVTGVCLMVLDHELDTGAVYRSAEVPIGADETVEELRSRLVDVGVELLVTGLAEGLGPAVPQDGEVTIAAKLTPDERLIRWDEPAELVHRRIRLGDAWTTAAGRRLKVWRTRVVADRELAPGLVAFDEDGVVVGTAAGAVELVEVQPEGKPRRSASDWVRGARLGDPPKLGEPTDPTA